jgi:hypothetical protein
MNLASAYVLCPLATVILYFREVLLKMSRVTEELQSYDENKRARLETETEGNLVSLSDRVQRGYKMAYILNGGVRGRQERQTGLLHKGRQGSDEWRNVQLRKAWQGQKEYDGI